MSAHPADTAQPGDAFRDENGVTWLRADDGSGYPWITSRRVEGDRWHNSGDARERTLTPLIPALTAEGVDIVAEWKKAAADRRAVADRLGVDCHIDAIIPAIRRLQVRAEDADAAAAALTEVGVPPGRDMTLADAIRTLADTPVDIPAPDASDASDPAQLRLAAAICDAAGTPGEANMTLHGAAEILRHRAGWDVAEVLVAADNDMVDVEIEYQQLHDHAHAQERLERNPHAVEAIRQGDAEESTPVTIGGAS